MTSPDPDDPITIRRPQSPAEYRSLQDVQRAAWGIDDDSYIVPVATLIGADKHGGLVLGAFRGDATPVGFSFAFLAKIHGRLGLYSQLTGILPGYQNRGLGTKLKLAQRDFALSQGIDLIAWAFDPLQAGNAHFNIARLGASCTHYYPDFYGPRLDSLNRGTPTDRLLAQWEVSCPPRPPIDPATLASIPRALSLQTSSLPIPEPAPHTPPADAPALAIEIPASITPLRQSQPQSALRWTLAVRHAFLSLFDRGYSATHFFVQHSPLPERGIYLLLRSPG
ncbi:MAG: hypothetical protein KatS3mg108_3109 [Isosphaeraceae bacterium]|jgi:predicted GNAT superfamily acetyltransferase|nr:MAG: hypothetical protein KatS3mg108_3109 [Isosphaeraceae bacterium]